MGEDLLEAPLENVGRLVSGDDDDTTAGTVIELV
jgi:hypothetical protein